MNIVKGDLLKLAEKGEFDVIVHGCNCHNNFGAGIALQIANRYPQADYTDKSTIRDDKTKLGTYTRSIGFSKTTKVNSFIIINAYTQYSTNVSKHVDLFEYAAFQNILNSLAEEYPDSRFGFPKIGCGLASENERRILDMIDDFSKLINGSVTVVEFG
jgi:O-acetyl-ADP-ribose deacetylase (regulator of RNase III)